MTTTMIRAYRYRHEAEIARALLESAGIRSILAGDDAGGMRPDIMSVNPLRLYVAAQDAEEAAGILADAEEQEAD